MIYDKSSFYIFLSGLVQNGNKQKTHFFHKKNISSFYNPQSKKLVNVNESRIESFTDKLEMQKRKLKRVSNSEEI